MKRLYLAEGYHSYTNMINTATFKQLALALAGVIEQPHFERRAFKVQGKKIFASVDEKTASANILLPVGEQAAYCSFAKAGVYPVPNKFGQQGWTTFELNAVDEALVKDALQVAWEGVTKKS